jgi:restriction system protein
MARVRREEWSFGKCDEVLAEDRSDERAYNSIVVSRRNSFLNDLFTLATRMHWLAALATAGALYVLLNYFAQRWGTGRLTGATLMQGGGGYLVLGTFARVLRYALPSVLVLGALVGVFTRWRRGHLFAAATSDPSTLLNGMNWQDFEKVVADAFTHNGYEVRERGGAQADGGVDLIAHRGGQRFFVQCKQWRSKKVDVATVREMLGIMSAHGADGGFVVAAGGFTSAAISLAEGRAVILVDNDRLVQMMRGPVVAAASPADPTRRLAPVSSVANPTCPQCRSVMVRRVATKGKTPGASFWGCSKYPSCRATRMML